MLARAALIAGLKYDDGYLTAGRLELVEAHLTTACPSCHRRLADSREVARIIRESSPVLDPRMVEDVGRAVRRRIRAGDTRKRPSGMLRSVVAVVALGLLAITLWPAASDAGSLLGDFVSFRDVPFGLDDDAEDAPHPTIGASAPTPFAAVEPTRLPLDLVRVERSEARPGRVGVNQIYQNEDGLSVRLEQFPTTEGSVVVDPDTGTYVVPIGGTNVLVVPDPWPDSVSTMFWERDGTVFTLSASGSAPGLALTDATDIVAAVIAAERDPPRGG